MPWATKHRPKILDEVLGQAFPKDIIRGALRKAKVGSGKGMSWLICGSYGCGKTTITRIAGKALACHSPSPDGEACQVCPSCVAIEAEVSHNYTEIDAASRSGVADIRSIVQEMTLSPTGGSKFRTLALDEAHSLSPQAQNALLKSVEEPSPCTHVMFITTDPDKLLSTIRSRCVIVELEPVDRKALVEHLARICRVENVEYEQAALEIIVAQSRGHVRNALTTAEKISLAGSLTLVAVRKSLHLELEDKTVHLVSEIGIDWDRTAEEVEMLSQDYPPSSIWKAIHRTITQSELFRLAPSRAPQSEHIKKLVERYGDRLTTASEWVLSKGEDITVRTETDLIVSLSVLSNQLGAGVTPVEARRDVKMGVPKRGKQGLPLNGGKETSMPPKEFAGRLGFVADGSEQ